MKRVTVSMCVYTTPGDPVQHTGVLMEKNGQKTVVDLENMTPVDNIEKCLPLPGGPQFEYLGFSPGARKAIKESQRLAAVGAVG